jgi:CHAT domain-containing protein
MTSYHFDRALTVLILCAVSLNAQPAPASASECLQRALHLFDLNNWAGAENYFAEAEQMSVAAGDQRNALYARLGRLRSAGGGRSLATTSEQLAAELEDNPLLQNDPELRIFCLARKGAIDGEIDSGAMRRDWEEVRALADAKGDIKWQYRALAQLGLAAFYDGDLETARKNVGAALIAATKNNDVGAQMLYLTAIGIGLRESHMPTMALPYFEKALKLADATPDAGYQFLTNEARLETLIDMGQADAAQRLADDIMTNARKRDLPQHEVVVLTLLAKVARTRTDTDTAKHMFDQVVSLSESGGFIRELAAAQSGLADIYRERGDLEQAEHFAGLSVANTQASGDAWAVPQCLQALAEIQASRGRYAEAEEAYARASAFIDAMIGKYSGVLEKTALIKASSDLYSHHFSLIAERLHDPVKAYGIVEQVRGRITTDLLRAGSTASDDARKDQRTLSELRLKVLSTRSAAEVRKLRDEIFLVEQSRWATPEISILKAQSSEPVAIEQVQRALDPSAVVVEYVIAEPHSYCLVISRTVARTVPLGGQHQIEALVMAYLKAVKAKQPAHNEARQLYDAVIAPVSEAVRKPDLIIVRDGLLHLVPFDAFMDSAGRYVAETHTVVYSPSASAFYLLATKLRHRTQARHGLLAVGGIPYGRGELKLVAVTRGYDENALADLPASKDEVLVADAAVPGRGNTLLIGNKATEAAFKREALADYRILHLAVHGFASTTDPNKAALVLLSDPAAGEDGLLQPPEIVQLKLNADLVILSACDTAVGPVFGEEGIATLSRAFLLAGARTVISTLWSVDDAFSLFLMKQFYQHLAAHESPAYALAGAKRDMLRKYGAAAVPYYWAGYSIEGAFDRAVVHRATREEPNVTQFKQAN